jgi:hypothetical protein
VPVGRKRHLAHPVGRPDSRALDPNAAIAERHLTRLAAVAHGDPIRVLTLRTHHLDDFFFHQFGENTESDAADKASNPSLAAAASSPSAFCT